MNIPTVEQAEAMIKKCCTHCAFLTFGKCTNFKGNYGSYIGLPNENVCIAFAIRLSSYSDLCREYKEKQKAFAL